MAVGRYIISTAGAVFCIFFRCFFGGNFLYFSSFSKVLLASKNMNTRIWNSIIANKKNNDNNNIKDTSYHYYFMAHRNLFHINTSVCTMFTFNGVALCSMVQKCENKLEILIEKFHPQYNFHSLSTFGKFSFDKSHYTRKIIL